MSDFRLSIDPDGRLVLIDGHGGRHHGVTPIRCFPLTDPDRWLSFCDERGRELASIIEPRELPPPVQETLAEYRRRHEFSPIIVRIERVDSRPDSVEWTVTTDRGEHKFRVKNDDDVRRLSNDSVLIIDAAGTHYRIPQLAKLESASRRLLDRYL